MLKKHYNKQTCVCFSLVCYVLCTILMLVKVEKVIAATECSSGSKSKARLIEGTLVARDGLRKLYVAVEISLESGWKTFWRHPGDTGGMPPYVDWSKSKNLAVAKIMFPKPKRIKSSIGDVIGYKHHVVLPIKIKPINTNQPIYFVLDFRYGICNKVCIPVYCELKSVIRYSQTNYMPLKLAKALKNVPIAIKPSSPNYPKIIRAELNQKRSTSELIIDALFPRGIMGADLFVESLSKVYLPVTKRKDKPKKNILRYRIDLRDNIDHTSLSTQKLRFTIVSDKISVEIERDFDRYEIPQRP